jgi:hypothetical protein
LTCRWLGLRPTHPSQRYEFCLRRFFMVNLPHGREIQGSLGVRSLSLRSILRLVRLSLSVNRLERASLPCLQYLQLFFVVLCCLFHGLLLYSWACGKAVGGGHHG